MSRAAKARVESADNGFNTVEHSFGKFSVLHVVPGGLKNTQIHRFIVLAGSDHQVGPGDFAVLVHFVVVMEYAARRLCLPCSLKAIHAGRGAHMSVENSWIAEDLFNFFDAVEHLNQSRMMVVEGTFDRSCG